MSTKTLCTKNNLMKPSQVFPSPVYPSLQVQVYVSGPVSVHVANSLQSSRGVPHIFISSLRKNKKKNKLFGFSVNYQEEELYISTLASHNHIIKRNSQSELLYCSCVARDAPNYRCKSWVSGT